MFWTKWFKKKKTEGIQRIQEFSDDELLAELENRFDDCFIFAGRQRPTPGKARRRRYWSGDQDACAGMAMGIAQSCLNKTWGVNQEDIIY